MKSRPVFRNDHNRQENPGSPIVNFYLSMNSNFAVVLKRVSYSVTPQTLIQLRDFDLLFRIAQGHEHMDNVRTKLQSRRN